MGYTSLLFTYLLYFNVPLVISWDIFATILEVRWQNQHWRTRSVNQVNGNPTMFTMQVWKQTLPPSGQIIIIIISKTMFMVLSSWQSHCESSPGSFDERRTAPSGRRPKTKPDGLGCESACTGCQSLHPQSPFVMSTCPCIHWCIHLSGSTHPIYMSRGNSLSPSVKNASSIIAFNREIETFLFRSSFHYGVTIGHVNVKEVNLYSASTVVPHTQVQITECYLQITPYLPPPRKRSPDGACPDWGLRTYNCSLLLIYLPPKGRNAESAWLAALQRTVYTHKWSPVSCRSAKVRRSKADVLLLYHASSVTAMMRYFDVQHCVAHHSVRWSCSSNATVRP